MICWTTPPDKLPTPQERRYSVSILLGFLAFLVLIAASMAVPN